MVMMMTSNYSHDNDDDDNDDDKDYHDNDNDDDDARRQYADLVGLVDLRPPGVLPLGGDDVSGLAARLPVQLHELVLGNDEPGEEGVRMVMVHSQL